MDFDAYMKASGEAFLANEEWRQGQAFFNVLVEYRPELAEIVRGTWFDPFYRNQVLPQFLTVVEALW